MCAELPPTCKRGVWRLLCVLLNLSVCFGYPFFLFSFHITFLLFIDLVLFCVCGVWVCGVCGCVWGQISAETVKGIATLFASSVFYRKRLFSAFACSGVTFYNVASSTKASLRVSQHTPLETLQPPSFLSVHHRGSLRRDSSSTVGVPSRKQVVR